jgi:hypothetical protein
MERITLREEEIYSRIIKSFVPDTPLFYCYLTPWDTKIIFHGGPGLVRAFSHGKLREITLLHVEDDLYQVIEHKIYKTISPQRIKDPYAF